MDAFDDHWLPCRHLDLPSLRGTTANLKIKNRCFHQLAVDQRFQVLVKPGNIQGIDALKIQFSIFIRLDLIPVDIIVIQGDQHRILPQHPQMGV